MDYGKRVRVTGELRNSAGQAISGARLELVTTSRRPGAAPMLRKTVSTAADGSFGLTTRGAADIIWTLASERTYLALVRDRGWNADDYERWLAEQLVAALLN